MSAPLDANLNAHKLSMTRKSPEKPDEECDVKKFEEEMKKVRKVDPDQRKERKRKQEEAEGKDKIIQEAQALIENQTDSLYAIQKPDIKHLLKKKKTSEAVETPFVLPSPINSASILFEEKDFTLNLSEPPSSWIAKEKSSPSFRGEIPEATFVESPLTSQDTAHQLPEPLDISITKAKAPSTDTEELITSPTFTIESTEPSTPSRTLTKKTTPITEKAITSPVFEFIPFAFAPAPDLGATDSSLHRLPPAFFAVLERIIGTITLLQTNKGSSTTTFCLNQPQFASSVFFGSTITIEESADAPKQFNIRLIGSAEAVEFFSKQKQELESIFTKGSAEGRFHFKVHRIEAELMP